MEYIVLLVLGLLAGTLGSLVGLGGGIIIVPALLFLGSTGFLSEASAQMAAGTSLLVIIFTGLSSTIAYYKQKKVDIKTGLILFISEVLWIMVVHRLNETTQMLIISRFVSIFMIFISIVLMFKDQLPAAKRKAKNGIWRTYIDSSGIEQTYGFQHLYRSINHFYRRFLHVNYSNSP